MKKVFSLVLAVAFLTAVCSISAAENITVFDNDKQTVSIDTDTFKEVPDGYSIEACAESKTGDTKDIQTIVFSKTEDKCKLSAVRTISGNTTKIWNESELGGWKEIQPDTVNSEIKRQVQRTAEEAEEIAIRAKAEEEARAEVQKRVEEEARIKAEKEARQAQWEKFISDPKNITEKLHKFNKNLVYIDSGDLPAIFAMEMLLAGEKSKIFYYVDKKSIQSRKMNGMSYRFADVYLAVANSDTTALQGIVKYMSNLLTLGMAPQNASNKYMDLLEDGIFLIPLTYSFNTEYPQQQLGNNPNKFKWEEITPGSVDEEIYKYVKRHSGITGIIGVSSTTVFSILGIIAIILGGLFVYKRFIA